MELRSKKRIRRNLIDISPLIDVVFLLLIFFMVTTTFLDQPGIPLDLPQTESHAKKKEIDSIKVVIDSDNNLYFSGQKIDLNSLEVKLGNAISKTGQSEVFIEADKNSKHGFVISVMDLAKKKGAKGITMITKAKKDQPD